MQISAQSISALINLCRQEINRFRLNLSQDDAACFEIFRRAAEEDVEEAFTAVYSLYLGLVYYWVRNHPLFYALQAEEDDLVAESFSRLFLVLKSDPFHKFSSLAAIMAYWRKCVHSVVVAAARTLAAHQTISIAEISDQGEKQDLDDRLFQKELWQRIEKVLADEKLISLAKLVILQGLKPRRISAMYADIWPTSEVVRVSRQKMKRKLAVDPIIRRMLDIEN